MSQLNLTNDGLAALLSAAVEVHNPEWAESMHLQTAVMLSPMYMENHLIIEPPFGASGYAFLVSFSWRFNPTDLIPTDDPDWVYNWQIKTKLRMVPNDEIGAEEGLHFFTYVQLALDEINPVAWWPVDVAAEHLAEEGHKPVFVGHHSRAAVEMDEYSDLVLSKIWFELDVQIEIPIPEDETAVFKPVLPQLALFFGLLERFIVDLSEAAHSFEV